MKKITAYCISLLIVIFFSSLFAGCKSKRTLKETKEIFISNYDSVYQSKISSRNRAINDSLVIALGKVRTEKKECDSVCQVAIDKYLIQLNTQKKSGDNSYGIFYDPQKNTLNFNNKIGETKSDTITVYKYIKTTAYIIKYKDVPVPVPLANWKLFLMISGAASLGYVILKITLFIKSKTPV
jgi:hypothetical protein